MINRSDTIQLRSFSLSRLLCLICLLICFCAVSCSSSSREHGRWKDRRSDELSKIQRKAPTEAPIPPWQTWNTRESFGVKEFVIADEMVAQGKFADALARYQEVEQYGISVGVKREALVRRLGTMLKTGASSTVLQQVADDTAKNGTAQKDIDPRISLLTAFAYYHLKDLDQTFAWLGVTNSNSAPSELSRSKATAAVNAILKSLNSAELETVGGRWGGDPFMGPMIAKERLQRASGSLATDPGLMAWFSPGRYTGGDIVSDLPGADSMLPGDQLPAAAGVSGATVGVLLPFGGQFGPHAEKVKQGIEFALSEAVTDSQIKLVFGDTKGEATIAVSEYERLVTQEQAKIVLGPLLYETSVSVAQKSFTLGVPFITFTKRSGVPELSPATFRLGVTNEDQVAELVQYASDTMGLKRFAVMSPSDPTSMELKDTFARAVTAAGGELVAELSFEPGALDYTSVANAVVLAKPQAVFLPGTLETSWQPLQAAKNGGMSDALIMGPASWDDLVAIRGYGQVLEGAVFVTAFYPFSVRGNVSTFVDGFRGVVGTSPDVLSAQAYDAAKIAFSAVDSPDSASLTQRLHSVDNYSGVTGSLSVTDSGEIKRRMTILKVHNGEVVEIVSAGQNIGFVPNGETQEQQAVN